MMFTMLHRQTQTPRRTIHMIRPRGIDTIDAPVRQSSRDRMPQILQILLPVVCVFGGYTLVSLLSSGTDGSGPNDNPYNSLRIQIDRVNQNLASRGKSSVNVGNKGITSMMIQIDESEETADQSDGEALFYMPDPNDGTIKKMPLPSEYYPKDGSVITLFAFRRELSDVEVALKSLAFLRGDDREHPSPVLIFNRGKLKDEEKERLIMSTDRPIAFPLVNFTDFPPGFDPKKEVMVEIGEGKRHWEIEQLNRFWITKIWQHPYLANFETIMKISPDSCFKEPNPYLPHFAHDHIVYHSTYIGDDLEQRERQENLYQFSAAFLGNRGKKPHNPLLWQHIVNMINTKSSLPTYDAGGFELVRKSFMTTHDLSNYLNALTELEPYGVLRRAWDVSSVRLMISAMYTTDDHLMKGSPEGYYKKFHCGRSEVEKALASFRG